jgi:potassium efflux system protein
MYSKVFHLVLAGVIIHSLATIATGQKIPNFTTASPTPSASPTPAAQSTIVSPTPIPLAEVVSQAEATTSFLRNVQTDLAADQFISGVSNDLPLITREIDARIEENQKLLNSRPSLDTLRSLDAEWTTLNATTPVWTRQLTARATALDNHINTLAQQSQIWNITLQQLQNNDGGQQTTPPEIPQGIQALIEELRQTKENAERQRAQVLTLQTRVAEQVVRIASATAAIKQVRDQTVNQLVVRDSPPIWSSELRERAGQNLFQDSQSSVTTQWATLKAYANRKWARFALHGVLILLLVPAFYWARRRSAPWVVAEPALEGVTRVFNLPIASAVVLTFMFSGWIYPQVPRLLGAIFGAVVLIPTVLILRQLLDRDLYATLYALVVFYFVDQLRTVSVSLPTASRLLFLGEMLGGFIFVIWLVRSARLNASIEGQSNSLRTLIILGARLSCVLFLLGFITNALGYVSLSHLLGTTVLGAAYLAIVLYAAVRIADGITMFLLRIHPLSTLGMVHRHRPKIRQRIQRFYRWIAVLVWVFYTLEFLSLRAPLTDKLLVILNAQLTVGSLQISLGNIVAFVLTIWFAFLLSRFLLFVLEEDVYPRIHLARGIPYALSAMLHYVILFVGFLFAVAALGIDMTRFTILAGAFGVGIGFGLQNVVNNFVSGLILLFERPINVGDMIQVGQQNGELRRIGMRASVIRTTEGSEVIVPNGKLISDEVINWTLSDKQRRLEIPVGVAYGTDPEQVIQLLTDVAKKHSEVLPYPAPQTLFIGFGNSALNFQLCAWTNSAEKWQSVKSSLTVGVNAALRDAGVSIPFPQVDLHFQGTSLNSGVTNPETSKKQ